MKVERAIKKLGVAMNPPKSLSEFAKRAHGKQKKTKKMPAAFTEDIKTGKRTGTIGDPAARKAWTEYFDKEMKSQEPKPKK